jgi:hypothetical protein
MAKSSGGAAAELVSLLGIGTRRRESGEDGCWPNTHPDRPDRPASPGPSPGRGCWPDSDDLNRGDLTPADSIRKITRRLT